MLVLNKSNTFDTIIVTLYDSQTLTSPYYLFVFLSDSTKEKFYFITEPGNDETNNFERYSKFSIGTSSIFSNAPVGFYKYKIYEQASSTNTNEAGLTELENGKMQLFGEVVLFIENNNIQVTFIQNNG